MRSKIFEHPGFASLERLLSGGAPSPAGASLLKTLGVSNFAQATRNLQSLALPTPSPPWRSFGTLETSLSAQAPILIAAYQFLRLAENRLRIATSHPIHTFPESPEGVEMLARRIGYQDDEAGSARAKLFADYEQQTGNVRRIYEVILQEAVA